MLIAFLLTPDSWLLYSKSSRYADPFLPVIILLPVRKSLFSLSQLGWEKL